MKAFAVLLALLVPAQARPQSALEQAGMLAGGPAPADKLYDGSRYRSYASDGAVSAGSGSTIKTVVAAPAGKEKKNETVVPSPWAKPEPKPGDPVAARGAVKGGIFGAIIGVLTGAVAGWAIGSAIGGALAIGLSMGIGALLFGAAAAAIGADVGKHCAVDPECG